MSETVPAARASEPAPGQGTQEAALAPFVFEIDSARRLLLVTKRGYWDMQTFDAFARTFRATLARMKASGGCPYCLVDARAFAVQSAEVAAALLVLVESFAPDCPRRMAGVTGSQLGRLQARRGAERAQRRAFASIEEARAWLFAAAD